MPLANFGPLMWPQTDRECAHRKISKILILNCLPNTNTNIIMMIIIIIIITTTIIIIIIAAATLAMVTLFLI